MKEFILAVLLLSQQCFGHPIGDLKSSMYNYQPTSTSDTSLLNIYNQIMSMLTLSKFVSDYALRLVNGFITISVSEPRTSTRSWNQIKFLESSDILNNNDEQQVDNGSPHISSLSRKSVKPENNDFYSGYSPVVAKTSQPAMRNLIHGVIRYKHKIENEIRNDKTPENSLYSSFLPIVSQLIQTAMRYTRDENIYHMFKLEKDVELNEGTLIHIMEVLSTLIQFIGMSG